jgi:branched-chain amino acid transport system permease protein
VNGDVIVGGLLQSAYFLLMGLGVVLVYRQSGVLNFSHGAIATLCGYIAHACLAADLPYPVAAIAAVATGTITAVAIERLLIRPLASQEHIIVGIATLGPALIIIALVGFVWGQSPYPLPGPLPDTQLSLGPMTLGSNETLSIGIAAALLIGVQLFLDRTRFGLAIRAASEGPLTAEMLGVDVATVRTAVWGLAGALAGIAALLITPHNVLGPNFLMDFMIGSFAAIVLGGMESIIGLAVGALLFGLLTAEFGYYVTGRLAATLNFVLIAIALLVMPLGRDTWHRGLLGRPLLRVNEPRLGTTNPRRVKLPQLRVPIPEVPSLGSVPRAARAGLMLLVVGAVLFVVPFATDRLMVFTLASLGVVFIAAVGQNLVSGYSGQISVGQNGFITIGAYTLALLSQLWHVPPVLAVVAAVVLSAAVGLAFGVLTNRLAGAYLALLTLAFAMAVPELAAYPQDITGGQLGMVVPSAFAPTAAIPVLDFMYWLIVALALLVGTAVHFAGRGWYGRRLKAVRDSEVGAASIGIAVGRTKLSAVALAGAFAGLSGAVSATLIGFIAPDSYTVWLSVYLLVAVVIGGQASTIGTLLGSAFVVLIPVIASEALASSSAAVWTQGFFGIAVLLVLWAMPSGLVSLVRLERPRPLRLVFAKDAERAPRTS